MQKNKTVYKFALASLTVSILAGCGTMHGIETAATTVNDGRVTTENALNVARAQASTASVVRHKGPRLNGTEIVITDAAKKLPAIFGEKFEYRSAMQSFDGVMADISRSTGYSVRKAIRPKTANLQSSAVEPKTSTITPGFIWNENLSGFLDQLARSQNLFWRFDRQTQEIVFFLEETRSFSVHVATTESTVASSISLAGAGGSSAGGSGASGGAAGSSSGGGTSGNVSISGTSKINAFDSVLTAVRGYAQEDQALQGLAQVNPSNQTASGSTQTQGVIGNEGLGMITVTATPPTLDRIATYIENVNKRFARNIYVNVKIYSLTLDDEAVNGLSISAAIANSAGTKGVDLSPSNLAQPNTGAPGEFKMRIANAGSKVDVVAQALRSLGNVTNIQSAQVVAANGQPSPFQIANDVSFVENSNVVVVPNVGVSRSSTQATRTVGLTGNIVPRYLDDNRMLLQYQLNLSSLTLTPGGTPDAPIQTSNIARQALQQQAFLEDGESLVLFGYEQQRTVSDKSTGILTVSNRGSSQRNMVVIVMDVFGDAKSVSSKGFNNG
ncbi:hypothetical protein [Delftia sp. GW456-R20]|uniref:hypothetical protein n=1 Tax=Delftia sp. GW456-R20 TaxID=1827145 RepID=UPI000A99D97F|nr:hypothetical protein [Delftia sp. GW456-R20]